MDADCILLNNIESLINNCSSFYVSNNRGVKDIFNGFLGTYPKNPIYKKIIDFMVQEGVNIKDYYYNCKQLYKIVSENYLPIINKNYYDDTIILWDKQHNDGRYYVYFKDNPLLVETNKYYPYNNS